MELRRLQDFPGGWLVGNFLPSITRTAELEVGVKQFSAGDSEPRHFQKVAVELTVVVSGACRMGAVFLKSGDVLVVQPGEILDFEALENCTVVAVKYPSIPGDKVLVI